MDLGTTVARVVLEADPATLRLFGSNLDRSPIEALNLTRFNRLASTDPHTLALLSELVDRAKEAGADGQHLLDLLAVAAATRDGLASQSQRSALVWTGPDVHESAFRETPHVIAELVDSARDQVLAVTFTLRRDSYDPNMTTLARLVAARRRGVAVTVVVHKSQANKDTLLNSWPNDVQLPRLLTWPIPDGDEMVKLHAKIVAVDDRAVLITSANLTYHGLFSNLELGIVVHGRVAGEVRRHFDRLEREGHLLEWE